MGKKTGIISFNLAERGRKYRGQDRRFDLRIAAALLNSGGVQERVKNGDMVGYFGHWPREKFGLDPAEGGFVDGKQVSLEPALRTTYLKAFDDGRVDHEVEFLDTTSGKIAEKIYGSKAYGFSSAIHAKNVGSTQIATGFYGFDFVKEPNYASNRGYTIALDGVMDADEFLDAVAERDAMFQAVGALLDQAKVDHDATLTVLDKVLEENEQLISMLSKTGRDAPGEKLLDGCLDLIRGSKDSPLLSADDFLTARLVGFESDESAKPSPKSATAAADKMLNRHYRA